MKIAAHITSFQKKEKVCALADLLLSIKPEICKVYIIDNSEGGIKYTIDNPKVEVTYLDKNYGVAKAVNVSIAKAIEDKIDWLWLFDDDSRPNNNTLAGLVDMIPKLDTAKTIILSSPYLDELLKRKRSDYMMFFGCNFIKNWIDSIRPTEDDYINNYVYCDIAIISGSLFNVKLLEQSGIRMAEELALDAVDFEFSYQIKKSGLKIVCVLDVFFRHRVGKQRLIFLKAITGYGPERYRLIMRNYYVFSRYYLKSTRFFIFRQSFFILLMAFSESIMDIDYKFKRVIACFKGLSEIKALSKKLQPRY